MNRNISFTREAGGLACCPLPFFYMVDGARWLSTWLWTRIVRVQVSSSTRSSLRRRAKAPGFPEMTPTTGLQGNIDAFCAERPGELMEGWGLFQGSSAAERRAVNALRRGSSPLPGARGFPREVDMGTSGPAIVEPPLPGNNWRPRPLNSGRSAVW